MKPLLASAAIITLLAIPVSMRACSVAGCLDRGIELRKSFSVAVTFQNKPLPGVTIQITSDSEVAGHQSSLVLTGVDGVARFEDLLPGDYWIKAELLGVTARLECFHINSSASKKAKKVRNYEWGDMPVAIRQAAGRLVDPQPGNGGSPIENLLQRVDVPIANARLELRQPGKGTVYATTSDSNGHFVFDRVIEGTYVLHAEPGTAFGDRDFDSTDLIISISDSAKLATLVLARNWGGAGSCGTSLGLRNK